ncbi:MAG: hypothetical protein QW323_04060 [Candidatus Bathyarchaeia archaeon]
MKPTMPLNMEMMPYESLHNPSVFLKLVLGEPGAERAKEILELVEDNKIIGYITPLTLEEVTFKVMIAQASSAISWP